MTNDLELTVQVPPPMAHGMVEYHPKTGMPVWSTICPKHNKLTHDMLGAGREDESNEMYLTFRCGKKGDELSHPLRATVPEGAPLLPADIPAWLKKWGEQKIAEQMQPKKNKRRGA